MIKKGRLVENPEMADLFEDFPELLLDDVILHKEILAHFGLLFSEFALLEAALQNLYILWQLQRPDDTGKIATGSDWEKKHEILERKAFGSTFGSLLGLLSDCSLLEIVKKDLQLLKKKRDYFAHHFFREENENMFSDAAVLNLIHRMNLLRCQVKQGKAKVDVIAHGLLTTKYPELDFDSEIATRLTILKATAAANRNERFGWENE